MVGISGRIGTHQRPGSAPSTAQVRVLLGAPQLMMRQALTAVLGTQRTLRVVGDVGTGKDALRWALEVRPDVTVLDEALTRVDRLHAVLAIHAEDPSLKLVLLTDGTTDTSNAVEVQEATAARVSKRLSTKALVDVLVRVAAGERPGEVADTVRPAVRRPVEGRVQGLKASERVLLELLVDGSDNRALAERLGCTEKTVRNRLSDLYAKLHLRNRTQAALYAIRSGLVDPENVEA